MVAASAKLTLTGCSVEAIRLQTITATMMAVGPLGHAVTNQVAQVTTTASAVRTPVKIAGMRSDHVSSGPVGKDLSDLPSSLPSASVSLASASKMSCWSAMDISADVTAAF